MFSVFFRVLPYSGPQWGGTTPQLSTEQLLGVASQIPAPHPMTACLPFSLKRILQTACGLIWAVAAILMAPRVVAQQPAFLTNGLVAYYPFNGNANDESGNGLNGTIYNSSNVLDSEGRFGTARSSFRFTDRINVIPPTIWGNGINIANSSHSIAFWTFGDFSTPDDMAGVMMGRG